MGWLDRFSKKTLGLDTAPIIYLIEEGRYQNIIKPLFESLSRVVCCLFGHSRAEILDRKEFDGGIIANIEEATNYVIRHTDVRYEIKNLRRKEIPKYPLEAYREAIVNAILHRDFFATSGDVVIEVHTNALRITNPGGLVKGLDRSNFGKMSRPRNRFMADLLLRTEFVERLGTGIARIKGTCETARLPPPEFEFDDYNFSITINGPKVETGDIGQVAGVPVKTSAEIEDFGVKFGEKFGIKFGVKGSRLHRMIEILLSLYENRLIDLSELALHYGMSKRTIEKDFSFLRRKGFIIFHGPRKTGRYVLTDKGKKLFEAL